MRVLRAARTAAGVVCVAALVVLAVAAEAPASERAPEPVLGVAGLYEYGEGWGSPRPSTIFNGGAPSGLARDLTWRDWGDRVARGAGRIATYKPGGGYYSELVPIQLKALRLGDCPQAPGQPAYTRMLARARTRPGGPYRDWFPWALDLCDPIAKPDECGSIALAPRTNFGASDITAFDTSCRTARSVARASRRVHIRRHDARYRLRTRRFVCSGFSSSGDAPRSISWTCARGTAVVTFTRT